MPDQLPLLVFPQRRTVQPEAGRPAFSPPPHLPSRARQIERLGRGLNTLQQNWMQYRASLSDAMPGLEPETVLVIEIIGRVDDFRAAVESAGLEWLGEWDQVDIDPDEDFYAADEQGRPKASPLTGRLFLSMANERGMRELLSLWELWVAGRPLPRGKSAWGKVFEQLRNIRRWGPNESLEETGMLDQWRAFLEVSDDPAAIERFQVEFFYHSNQARRQRNELQLRETLGRLGGSVIGAPIDISPIAFHAMKGELPRAAIEELVQEVSGAESDIRIDLLKLSSIMFFRPTGQSLAVSSDEEGQPGVVAGALPDLEPVAALFDGVPLQLHDALLDRLDVNDMFSLEPLYQPGERKHGTAMASLIVHGDTGGGVNDPLRRRLLCVPVMQPNETDFRTPRSEHMPDDVFFEDRIQIAVRRMFEAANGLEAQAPQIKVINLSIGDPSRLLAHTLSPWARLLDWLSYEYRVLFCVSAGNYTDDIQMGLLHSGFSTLSDDQKVEATLKAMQQGLADRRVMSPAESMNALTVGALHADEFGPFPLHRRVDVMPGDALPSPAMRLGHGFRRSVKPEILLAGGRQLYKDPIQGQQTAYQIDPLTAIGPGQKVATDSTEPGKRSNFGYWKGTSNATALATRGAVRIHDMLQALREQQGQDIPDGLMAVLMKALLVHGARQPEEAKAQLESALKTSANSRQFRTVLARYLGYGAADIERVLACTEQRATVLGCDEIRENEIHEYEFPLPVCMSGQRLWRRLVVTLAWFTPINPAHRNLREAKLELAPAGSKWATMPLKLDRVDADHNQMLRGTVQHEVLESQNAVMAFQDGDVLRLRVHCKRDGVERLDRAIPYGLAVTLEVKQDLPIYQEIKARVATPVAVRPPV
jgi:hypothetical protein